MPHAPWSQVVPISLVVPVLWPPKRGSVGSRSTVQPLRKTVQLILCPAVSTPWPESFLQGSLVFPDVRQVFLRQPYVEPRPLPAHEKIVLWLGTAGLQHIQVSQET